MRKLVMAVVALTMVGLGLAPVAGAGTVPMDLLVTIDPTSGPAATVVTFTPKDLCPVIRGAATNAPGDPSAAISLLEDPTGPSDFLADTPVDGTGSWTLDHPIPTDAPAGDITFYAFCIYETAPTVPVVETAAVPDDFVIVATYAPVVFTVTEPPASSTTTTTEATTTTTAPPSILADPTTVEQGGTIAVSASGFAPGSDVVITLESDPVNLGTFVADSAGRLAANVVVPADFPTGQHTLKLTGVDIAGSVLVLSTGIVVASRIQVTTAAPTSVVTTATTLPATGTSLTAPALTVGALLLLGGAATLLAVRRRRASTPR